MDERRANELALGDGDNVDWREAASRGKRRFLPAENFPEDSASAIPQDGSAYAPRRDNPKPIAPERIRPANERHVPRRHPAASLLHGPELAARAQANTRGEG